MSKDKPSDISFPVRSTLYLGTAVYGCVPYPNLTFSQSSRAQHITEDFTQIFDTKCLYPNDHWHWAADGILIILIRKKLKWETRRGGPGPHDRVQTQCYKLTQQETRRSVEQALSALPQPPLFFSLSVPPSPSHHLLPTQALILTFKSYRKYVIEIEAQSQLSQSGEERRRGGVLALLSCFSQQ